LPLVSIALVLANVVVYVIAIVHGGSFLDGPSRAVALQHGAIPAQLSLGAVFSSIFIHGSFLQLFANSIALALFGLNVEDALGRARFLAFYVLGALVALALTVLFAPNSHVPQLGSSGAVAAVLGAYLLLYPRARVIGVALIPFMATIVEVPAVLLIGVWLLVQLWVGLAGLAGPIDGGWAIAYAAQCGALLLGALAIRPLANDERRAAKRRQPPPQPVY
jgi:membrane associated rhomboid family serine protease